MGLIKEPKNIDFSMKSEPWSEVELKELSDFIKKKKTDKRGRKKRVIDKVTQSAGSK